MKIVQYIFMMGFLAAMTAAFLAVPLRSWFVLLAACFASMLVACGFTQRRSALARRSTRESATERLAETPAPQHQTEPHLPEGEGEQCALLSSRRADRLLEAVLDELPRQHSLVEFVRGLSCPGDDERFNMHTLWEVAETLSAMSNSSRGTPGRVVIGVLEGSMSFTIEEARHLRPLRYGRFWILGLAHEVSARQLTGESYLQDLLQRIQGDPCLDPALRRQVARDALVVDFLGKPVVVLSVTSTGHACSYGEHYPVRQGPRTLRLTAQDLSNHSQT